MDAVGSDILKPLEGTQMRRAMLPVLALSFIAVGSAIGQDQQDVMRPIHRLFDAMRTGDSAVARAVFHPQARLVRLPLDVENFQIDETDVDDFIAALGGGREETWEEPIWDWEVRIDGNLAAVWAKYAFFRDGKFSHCGVDAFQLVNTPGGWRIVSLTYSRRLDACELPPGR